MKMVYGNRKEILPYTLTVIPLSPQTFKNINFNLSSNHIHPVHPPHIFLDFVMFITKWKQFHAQSHLSSSIHFISTPKIQYSNLAFPLCPSPISINPFYYFEFLIWFRCMNYILYILIYIRVSKWLKIYQNFNFFIYWALYIEIDLAMLIAYLC